MNRDTVLLTLVLGLCGPVTWLSAWASGRLLGLASVWRSDEADRTADWLERRHWFRIWFPLAPAAITLALLGGWALQEPRQTDEILRPIAPLCVLPAALVWLRALWRAAWALRPPAVAPLAATIGIVRPRIVLDPRLGDVLDGGALAAARAHEQAHARHRDPLRIWLAQFATDLQWPSRDARRRLASWANALELARDEEARRSGVPGGDLASAVVTVAGLTPASVRPSALASLTQAEIASIDRVRRLLAPLPVTGGAPLVRGAARASVIATVVALIGVAGLCVVVGFEYGDMLVRALPLIA